MRLLLSLALLAFGVLTVWRPLPGFQDFWAHAAAGRWMVENGQVADRTLGLWTADEPHVYHHWLTEVLFYGLAECGPTITMGATVVLALVPFAAISFRGQTWMAIPIAFALEGLAVRLQTRPELFTAIGITVVLTTRLRWSLIPLFALWANLHGGVVIGVLLLCASLRFRAAFVAFLACNLNPYGLAYWKALSPVNSYTFQHLLEWKPLWEAPAIPTEMAQMALGLLVLALFFCRRKEHVLWLLLLGGLAMLARRNLWPFTIACLCIASSSRLDFGLGAMKMPLQVSVLFWVILLTVPMPMRNATGTDAINNGIVRWMHETEPSGRIFADYTTSNYLQWARVGPLYIDGLNAYPDQVTKDYFDIVRVNKRGQRLLEGVDVVILGANTGTGESLGNLADWLDKNWKRAYCGPDGVIWTREGRPGVRDTDFRILEKWGNEDDVLHKGIPENFGGITE